MRIQYEFSEWKFIFFISPFIGGLQVIVPHYNGGLIMKISQTIFFGIVCVAFLCACDKIQWVTSEEVTVAWDAPKKMVDGSPIPAGSVLRYNVYIDTDNNNTHDDKILETEVPISETSFTLPAIKRKGKYFVGVQSLAYMVKDGKIYGAPKVSDISWSSSKSNTKAGPFGISIE